LIDVKSTFTWLGNAVADAVYGEIDNRLTRAGYAWLAEATRLVPVDTGALRNSLGFRVEGRTLTVYAHQPYSLFVEHGTRRMAPRPYMRPALNALGPILGASLEMEFAAPGAGTWQGLYAHQGSFIAPSGHQPRPLTQAQHRHVREHLMPVSKRLYHGHVRKAKMTVRRFD
jgi:hypothetical protein